MRDANGQALAFIYCEDEPGRRATGKLLTPTRRGASPPISLSCRTCCVGGRRKSRCDEIAAAHFRTIRAMSA